MKRETWLGVSLLTVIALGSFRLEAQGPATPAVAPGAPSGLVYLVNASNVSLFWTHSSGPFTHYIIEAGGAPGTTFFSYPTSSRVDPSTLPQLLSAFGTSGVPAGSYYVRVRGANGGELGPATPDIIVPVTGACQPPGPPADLTAIIRTNVGWLQWAPGSGGLPTLFTLLASATPGWPPLAAFPTTNGFVNVAGIPPGTYYVRVVA